jgi:hypothetical protein
LLSPGVVQEPGTFHFSLDINNSMSHKLEKKYSISEMARHLSIHRSTLHRWIALGVVPRPIEEDIAGARLRYWLKEGFERVKTYKEEHFREGQGQRTQKKRNKVS